MLCDAFKLLFNCYIFYPKKVYRGNKNVSIIRAIAKVARVAEFRTINDASAATTSREEKKGVKAVLDDVAMTPRTDLEKIGSAQVRNGIAEE